MIRGPFQPPPCWGFMEAHFTPLVEGQLLPTAELLSWKASALCCREHAEPLHLGYTIKGRWRWLSRRAALHTPCLQSSWKWCYQHGPGALCTTDLLPLATPGPTCVIKEQETWKEDETTNPGPAASLLQTAAHCQHLPWGQATFIHSSFSHLQAHKVCRGCKQHHSAGCRVACREHMDRSTGKERGFPWSYSQVRNAKWGMAERIPSVELGEQSSLV